jgi:hypothetical protein
MADEVKDLLVRLEMQNKEFNKSIAEVDSKLGRLNTQQSKTQKGIAKLKGAYLAVAAVLTGVVAKAFAGALKQASAFEEANSKFGVVFRGVSKEANTMRKELVDSYGVSTLAATEMLSGIQDFLVPMGLARDEAAELSGNFSKLAVDIGSFNNAPTADVLAAIKSGLAGQSEPLRRFGVDVSETTLKQMALAQGIELTNGKLDRQSRAQLLYQKIVKDSSDALGDFARTQNSTANIMKRAAAIADDIKLVFGQELAKEIQPSVDAFNKFLKLEGGLEKIRKGFKGLFILMRIMGIGLKTTLIEPIKLLTLTMVETLKSFGRLGRAVFERDFKSLGKIAKESIKNITKPVRETAIDYKDAIVKIGKDTIELFKKGEEIAIEGTNNIVANNNNVREQELMATEEQIAQIQALEEEAMNLNILKKQTETEEIKKLNEDQANSKIDSLQKQVNEEKKSFDLIKFMRRQDVEQARTALGDIATLTQSSNKTLFKVGKAASIAQAVINNALAVTKTMSTVPFPFNIPLAAGQALAGAVQINKISNTKFQGKAQGGVVDEVMGSPINGEDGFIGIQRGESVLTREATANMGRGVIDAINQTGGKAALVTPNITVNVSNPNPQEVVNVINDYMRQYGSSEQGVSI